MSVNYWPSFENVILRVLGSFILSNFVYRFLRRYEKSYFEYHHLDDEDDAYENFISSTTTIFVGPKILWFNPNPFDNTSDSSAVNYPPYNNSFKLTDSVNNCCNIHNGFQHNSDEEHISMRKEKLYLLELNRSRPRKFRKI